jgi:diguanylate cyclase (GGDEF)-like protein
LAWKAFDTRQPASVDDYATWELRRRIHDSVQVHAAVDLPIYTNEKGIGVLALGRGTAGHFFDAEQLRYGALFAQLAALVLDNSQLREALRQEAIRDALTGLYNRRFMQEWLERELQRAARLASLTCLFLLDVDHFKQINDTYGHAAGDFVLLSLGRFLTTHLRGSDIACRYGGEEFVFILPDASPATALRRAEKIRKQVEEIKLEFQSTTLPPLCVSIGIAIFPIHGDSCAALLEAADAALYRAKHSGRNRVEMAA